MYYAVQVTTAFILIMAANTAYADLPLLLSLLGRDGFVPRQFAKRGKRLSFSNGIILLCIASCVLIIAFGGDTHHLLPLYAVGVFISFTLSQTGMFTKWIREKTPGYKHKAVINGLGALVTFVTVIIIGITKFKHGAWIVCVLIPIFVFIMLRIKQHYIKIAEQLKLPLLEFIDSEEHASKPGETVTVVLSQFVITKWWHNILHNQTSLFIKNMLYK